MTPVENHQTLLRSFLKKKNVIKYLNYLIASNNRRIFSTYGLNKYNNQFIETLYYCFDHLFLQILFSGKQDESQV